METLGLEKRVDSVLQLYLQFMPQNTAEEQRRGSQLRERAPGAGRRFQNAVARAAAGHYTRTELQALDRFFASEEGQRVITTGLTRALFSMGRGGAVKGSDILRPEDLAAQPGLEKVATKYPAFEAAARAELGREFAQEIALLATR